VCGLFVLFCLFVCVCLFVFVCFVLFCFVLFMNDSTPNPKMHSIHLDFFGPCLYERMFSERKKGRKKEGRKKKGVLLRAATRRVVREEPAVILTLICCRFSSIFFTKKSLSSPAGRASALLVSQAFLASKVVDVAPR